MKVATWEPGDVFKEYDLHKVQSLEISLFQMDAISVNYWLTKYVQEVACNVSAILGPNPYTGKVDSE